MNLKMLKKIIFKLKNQIFGGHYFFAIVTLVASFLVLLNFSTATAIDFKKIVEEARPILDEKSDLYREFIELRARKLLDTQLGETKYSVLVSLKFNEEKFLQAASQGGNKIDLKSIPIQLGETELQTQLAEWLTPVTIRRFISKTDVALTIEEGVTSPQIDLIRKMLSSGLNIPVAQVQIKAEKLESVSLQKKLEESKQDVQKSEKSLLVAEQDRKQIELKSQLEKQNFEQEKAQIVSKLTASESERKQIEGALAESKKTIARLEEEVSVFKTPLGDIKKIIKGLEVPLMVFPFLVLILLISIVFSIVFNSVSKAKSKKFFEGIELVSHALGKAAGRSAASQSQGLTSNLSTLATHSQSATASMQNAVMGNRDAPAALSAEELMVLKKEVVDSWKKCMEHEFLCMSEIKEWVATGPEGQMRLLSLLAILPSPDSTRLVTCLSSEDIHSLRGIYLDTNQRHAGFSLCHGLARTIMLAALSAPPVLKTFKGFAVLQASDRQYAEFLMGLSSQNCAAGLSLLPTSRFVRVVEVMSDLNPDLLLEDVFALLVSALNDDPGLENLRRALDEFELSMQDQSKGVRGLASELLLGSLESVSPKIRNQILHAVQKDSSLAFEANLRALTIEALLTVSDDVVRELTEPFDSEELAKLIIGLSPALQERISAPLSQKLKASVISEFNRIRSNSLLERKAQLSGLQIQSQIINALREMVSLGLVAAPQSSRTFVARASREPRSLGQTEASQFGESADTSQTNPRVVDGREAS